MSASRPRREVILWGIGHTNIHVLRAWRENPVPGARLTCVSTDPRAAYSGMLPGVLAGLYPRERMEIDLPGLSESSGARLVVGEVEGVDRAGRRLLLAGGSPLPFDALAIGIGSEPARSGVVGADEALAIKPMPSFLDRLDGRLRPLGEHPGGRPLRVTVVGGGAGGSEVALCLPAYVRATLGDRPLALTLVDARDRPGGLLPGTARRLRRIFEARGARLVLGRRVVRIGGGEVEADDGSSWAADLVIWATGARGPAILETLGLPTDDRGFLRTRPTLQTLGDDRIFAVGDCGTIEGTATPKAGVHAVREGPVLWRNLVGLLDGRPPVPYNPQAGFLKLLNTGDGRAIGEFAGLSFEGRWCWLLKDFIDRRFVARYQQTPPPSADA